MKRMCVCDSFSFWASSLTVCLPLSPLSHAQPSWVGVGAILGSNPHPPTHFGDHEWRPPYGEEADYTMLCDVAMQCGGYGVQWGGYGGLNVGCWWNAQKVMPMVDGDGLLRISKCLLVCCNAMDFVGRAILWCCRWKCCFQYSWCCCCNILSGWRKPWRRWWWLSRPLYVWMEEAVAAVMMAVQTTSSCNTYRHRQKINHKEAVMVMDGDSVAELCWQTRLRIEVGGQRQSQRQSRRPRLGQGQSQRLSEAETESET